MLNLSTIERLSFRKQKTSVFLSKENLSLLDEISRVSGISRSKIINQFISEKIAENPSNLLYHPRKSLRSMSVYMKNI